MGGNTTRERDWISPDGAFLFGKYSGRSVSAVVADDPGYCRWVVESVENITDQDRQMIATLLKRGYGR